MSLQVIFDNIGDMASLRGEFMIVCKQADEDGTLKVKATADDAHLGSENSDTKIVDLCAVVMVPCVLQRFSAPGNERCGVDRESERVANCR